jgi:hypothetical protein
MICSCPHPPRELYGSGGRFKELRGLERDPVCGMLVDPALAPASIVDDDATLRFCSRGCRQQYEDERVAA